MDIQKHKELLDQLSTGLITYDSSNDSYELNLAAMQMLGLDAKALSSEKIKDSHPNLSKLLKQIKNSEIEFDSNKKSKRLELNTNGQYFGVSLSRLNDNQVLIELNKISEKQIGQTTHELKRPIQNIKTLTESLLLGAKDDPAMMEKFLKNIDIEADRLGGLVNDILRLSSLRNGSIEIKKTTIKVKDKIDHIVNSLTNAIQEKHVSINNSISSDLTLEADNDLLGHLLENLIENAIKYNQDSGQVFIESLQNDQIQIRDTGIGMKRDDLERIFEQFYRVDNNIPGTGLGLSIVKNIVDLHNGSIDVQSEYGSGTSFTIKL